MDEKAVDPVQERPGWERPDNTESRDSAANAKKEANSSAVTEISASCSSSISITDGDSSRCGTPDPGGGSEAVEIRWKGDIILPNR